MCTRLAFYVIKVVKMTQLLKMRSTLIIYTWPGKLYLPLFCGGAYLYTKVWTLAELTFLIFIVEVSLNKQTLPALK